MASDDTTPKVRMLLTIGVVAVSLLLGVKFVLDSYYLDQTEGYEHSLLPKTELLTQTRTEQHAALDKGESGNIPVSVAMQTLASKGRDNASAVITPEPSEDVDPLKGWAKLPRQLHLPPQVTTTTAPFPPPATDAGAPTNALDAGAPALRDGGVHAAPRQPPPQQNIPKDGGA
jgi:hypothetical protein